MSTSTPGFVSNEVLAAKLDMLTDEVRELRRELVRRDVYEEQRKADLTRVSTLEARLAERDGERRQAKWALVGAALALAVSLVRPFFG